MERKITPLNLKREHHLWKENNHVKREPFFPVFKNFKDYLGVLSPGAVSLFLYFGLFSQYNTGECFHSIETISQYFGKSTRTISNWIKELEEIGLVHRAQLGMSAVSHTFLRPYPNSKIEEFLLVRGLQKSISKQDNENN